MLYQHILYCTLLCVTFHESMVHAFTVANYQDSSCTQITSGQNVQQQQNGACIQNPQSSSQSARITCADNTANSTYSFVGYLTGDCTGTAALNDMNEQSLTSCLDIVGYYFAVDCSSTDTALAGVPTPSPTPTVQSTTTTVDTTEPAAGSSNATTTQSQSTTATSVPNITGASLGSSSQILVSSSVISVTILAIVLLV